MSQESGSGINPLVWAVLVVTPVMFGEIRIAGAIAFLLAALHVTGRLIEAQQAQRDEQGKQGRAE